MAISKIILNGVTQIDLTQDTVANASHIMNGYVGHFVDGTQVTGTGQGSGTLISKTITLNGTYDPDDDNADGYSSVTVNVQNGASMTEVSNTYGTEIVVSSAQGATPSATKHTIHFDFSDETDTDIDVYYDDTLLATMIQEYTPATYGQKTVTLAQLDGVTWYSYDPTERWETIWDENIYWSKEDNGDYPYCWISSLGNLPITVGSVWRVTYNNIEYRCTAATLSLGGQNFTGFGNPGWSNGTDDGSDVPFVFIDYTIYGAWTGGLNVPNVNNSYYFKIERLVTS